MRCSKADKLMSIAFDGALDADRQRMLDEHLASCSRCRALVGGWADLSSRLDQVAVHDARWGFADRLAARMDAPATAEPGMVGHLRRLHVAGVSVALIAFCLGVAASSGIYTSTHGAGGTTAQQVVDADSSEDRMEALTNEQFAPIPDDSTGGMLLAMLASAED